MPSQGPGLQRATSTQLVPIAYEDLTGQQPANSAQVATVTVGPPNFCDYWQVEKIAVQVADGSGDNCQVFKGDPSTLSLVGGTTSPALDFDDADPAYTLGSDTALTLVFNGVNPGVMCSVRAQVVVIKKVQSYE